MDSFELVYVLELHKLSYISPNMTQYLSGNSINAEYYLQAAFLYNLIQHSYTENVHSLQQNRVVDASVLTHNTHQKTFLQMIMFMYHNCNNNIIVSHNIQALE